MSKNVKIYILILAILVVGAVLLWQFGKRSIEVKGPGEKESQQQKEPKELPESTDVGINPITGLECENYNRRPIATMLAMDPTTRPLSGVGAADLVIEMPVITDSITRLMVVYICEEPKEIGSLRSSRHDFIPLAMGLDAIYAHWGGSHYALDKLNAGIMDNIDALKNPYNAFWQKSGIPMPHNGFTSMARLVNAAEKLGYRLENKFEGYPHISKQRILNNEQAGELTIGYKGNYRVFYKYNPETNSYLRWRKGTKEIDKLTGKQVETQNIAVMRAASRMIQPPDYNDVDVEGIGEAIVYRNGEEIKGTWKKAGKYQPTKLYFLDSQGKEIKFVPGKIWIEIVEPYTRVTWEIK